MSIIYDIIFMMQLKLCVLFWFLLLGNCDRLSATIIFLPWICSISLPCSSSIIHRINTLFVLQIVGVIFLWLLCIVNNWYSNIVQYVFKVLRILSSSFSVAVYLFISPVGYLFLEHAWWYKIYSGLPHKIGLTLIPDYLSIRSSLNSWPINYDPWLYYVSIFHGYLVIHVVSTKFATVISRLS